MLPWPLSASLQVIQSIASATIRNDLSSVLTALELSTQLHMRDGAGVKDTVVRHVGSLPVWKDFRLVVEENCMSTARLLGSRSTNHGRQMKHKYEVYPHHL